MATVASPWAPLASAAMSPGARSSIASPATVHLPTRPVSRAPNRGSAIRLEKNSSSGVEK